MKRMSVFNKQDMDRYQKIWSILSKFYDEKNRRLLAAAMVLSLGYGANKVISGLTGMNPDAIKLGREQIEGIETMPEKNRMRRKGGGRKPITEIYKEIEKVLLDLIEKQTKDGQDYSHLRTSKGIHYLAKTLTNMGYPISSLTVSKLLIKHGYSKEAKEKRYEIIVDADSSICKHI